MVETQVIDKPLEALERAFVDEFLQSSGYTRASLEKLPKWIADRILAEAAEQASLLLAQIDSRARLLRDLDTGHNT